MARLRPNPPPARDGLSPSCVVVPGGAAQLALDFFCGRFPFISAADWARRMLAGDVVDTRGTPIAAHTMLHGTERLYYYREVPPEPAIPFQETVLWQDAHLLVADKPHFLPVIPSGKYVRETLLVRLKKRLGLEALSPIHRIDRDTAGLVMFSVDPATRNAYQALFRERLVHKLYHAVADWNPALPWPLERASRIVAAAHFMQQCEAPGAPNAFTLIRPLQVRGNAALYELRPHTGQRHQLRVHMAALGLPLYGDDIYPTLLPEGPPDYRHPLQLLAKKLSFTDPLSGELREFESQRSLWADAEAAPAGGAS